MDIRQDFEKWATAILGNTVSLALDEFGTYKSETTYYMLLAYRAGCQSILVK